MSQEVKTITLVLLALVCGIAAVVSSREAPEIEEQDVIGTKFVDVDPLEVTQLKVVRFQSDTGRRQPFEVAKSGERFTIPSHENYPADAKDRIKDSVNLLNGSDILAVASEAKESHEDFGVLDPEDDSLGQGAVGVGMRVTMGAGGDDPLADFIVGKEVKDQDNQYYVRKAGKNQVYVIQIEPDKLSTKFEDWVERDFLKFNPLDMEKVVIENYSLRKEERVDLFRGQVNVVLAQDWNSKVELDYKNSEWSLVDFETFDDQENPSKVTLDDEEELNKEKLNAMKDALDDLEIVDVRRKPEDFQANWDELQKENPKLLESMQKILVSLQQRGFYVLPPQGPDQGPLFLSDNGEINVGMEDGVKYTLRFGNTAGAGAKDDGNNGQAAGEEEAAAGGAGDDEGEKGADLLRYLLVTAEFDESLLEKPELEDVPPEEPPTEKPATEKTPAEETPAEKPDPSEPPAEQSDVPKEDTPAANGGDKPAPDEVKPDESGGDNTAEPEQPCGAEEPTGDEETTADDAAETGNAATAEEPGGDDAPLSDAPAPDEAAPDKPADDETAPDAPAAENAAGGGDDDTAAAEDAAKDEEAEKKKKLDEWKKKRDDIIKENDRKKKEYEDKVAKGKKHVDELNERFEAWYYVISNETYNKIRLSRADIVKKKEKDEDDKDDGATSTTPDADAASPGETGDAADGEKSSIDRFNELKAALPADDE